MSKKREYDEIPGCAIEAALNRIGGKWKGVFLYHLLEGTLRFNQLTRLAAGASPRMVIKQLRELEDDGLVSRKVYPVVPPKVEYSLTDEGRSLQPILLKLDLWGKVWMDRRGIVPVRSKA
ncbi:winged helix-turn-helix transcriptional regulator [Silvibacterium acidisoli]|uniref:winged helix-turn-helix transcriptional regulator n=1 Tax=Acidobacteriaceae bacterium ZG23-2 TaxID=2883246 RepID=UPI00406CF74C